jgi:hypothetical protein
MRPADRLIGLWQGRPETAADRLREEQDKRKKEAEAKSDSAAEPAPAVANDEKSDPPQASTFEKFDFTMKLDFENGESVQMTIEKAGEQRALSGEWTVVSSEDEKMVVQITPKSDDKIAKARTFEIRFLGDAQDRFVLREKGTDPKLGAILFERVE